MSVHSQAEVTFITYCVILYNHQSGIGEGLSTLQSIYLICGFSVINISFGSVAMVQCVHTKYCIG